MNKIGPKTLKNEEKTQALKYNTELFQRPMRTNMT